jgi:NAD+ kinase
LLHWRATMRFGFLLKPGKPEAPLVAAELAGVLRRRNCPVLVATDEGEGLPGFASVSLDRLGASIDVLVILGGDGTFLYGASLVADHGVPLLGVNLGTLGFMTHYTLSEAPAAVEAVADGRLRIDERMRLQVTLRSAGREIESRTALNEAVLQRTTPRLLDLQVELASGAVTTYKADGLILSTPTGSTAYNLAAGGPILTPDLEVIVLTPICPHTLTNRPVVIRADALASVTNVSTHPVTLTVDGRWTRDLQPGDAIDVRKAEKPLRTFQPPSPFFNVLRRKLSWGERQG